MLSDAQESLPASEEDNQLESAYLDRAKKLEGSFENHADRFERFEFTEDGLAAAVGYWVGYPQFVEAIGHHLLPDRVSRAAYDPLNYVHMQAVRLLM